MIQSNTLRIGNLVNYKGNTVTIDAIGLLSAMIKESPLPIEYDDLEPIPITEDILVRMGFKNSTIGWQRHLFKDNSIGLIKLRDSWLIGISGGFGLVNIKHINSIDQLQNVFYFCSQQELTLADL